MLTAEKMEKFAELAVRVGANMQKGQEVAIRSDVKCVDFAHLLAKKAYEYGASRVHIQWRDETLDRINTDSANKDKLCERLSYIEALYDYFIDRKCCVISVSAGDPNIYKGCDPDRVAAAGNAEDHMMKKFRSATMSNYLRWTIVSVPTAAWAKQVYPNKSEEAAVNKMWDDIAMIMRLNEPDPTAAWKQHIGNLHRRADFLNEKNFEYIRFTSADGTDLKVGLAKDHVWLAAEEEGQDGIPFTANMPTEEVFTAPHKRKINGVVKNALPLVHKGNVIDGFSVTFKDGKVTSFSAETGYDTLKGILTSDEGVKSLGEIALIGKHSPIAESGVLFYNTLFDENASCHLAFGKAYPTTVKNGNGKTQEELDEMGVNDSLQHVDFMVGTKDFCVEGIGFDGKTTVLFENGDWIV